MRRLAPLVLLSFLLATAGCRSHSKGQLCGQWRLAPDTRQFLPANLQNISPILDLGTTNTFFAVDFPEALGSSSTPQAVTGSGTWELGSDDGEPSVQLVFRKVTSAAGTTASLPFGTHLTISGDGVSTRLTCSFGDADSGRRLAFLKTS